MIHTIENERLRVSVLEQGAELAGIWDKQAQYEYMWSRGDIWKWQSPMLFPVVGKLRDDTYSLNGKQYHLPKHGFARMENFTLEHKTQQDMTFLLTENARTLESFPYAFELRADYSMQKDGLAMRFRVKNPGAETMYFSLGAHPGFHCEMGDRVVFDLEETSGVFSLDANGLRSIDTIPMLHQSRDIAITPEIFQNGALIFDGLRSPGATLVCANGKTVHMDFGGAPSLGLWAMPGADYVCIEPWYGIDDRCDAYVDFPQKERICTLAAGEEFVFPMTITVL